MAETLPEGTDHIVPGAAATSGDDVAGSTLDQAKASVSDLRDKAQSKAEEFRAQAGDTVRDYADQGKERAAGGLDEVARLISDNAKTIDEKLGAQYGDYARRAADAVSGVAGHIRDKEVEDLLDDARSLVRRSPGVAIGVAAAAGFMLSRIIKSGSEALETATKPKSGGGKH